MSRILTYSKTLTSIGSPDGEVNLDNPLRMNPNTPKGLRLCKFSINSQIPNVINWGGVNNGLLRVSPDNGVNWTNIQLTNGIYSISLINSAIQSVISTWWTLSTDPGLIIRSNTATQEIYLWLDQTKLAVVNTILVDFNPTVGGVTSVMYQLLGFAATTTYTSTGAVGGDIFTAPSYARMDWFGNNISVRLKGFGNISISNGSSSNELCQVPLSVSTVSNEYLYPVQGLVSPWILVNALDNLSKYAFEFRSETGQIVPLLEGSVNIVLELREY